MQEPTQEPTPQALTTTRRSLQLVATHVLARRRHDVTGRFGLRATPGGFGTPAFGPPDAVEVVRVASGTLVHEVGGDAVRHVPLHGASLAALAAVVGVALDPGFSAGDDTPPIGDPDAPLEVDGAATAAIGAWFDLGWRAIDAAAAGAASPSTIQLWPERFDAACSVATGRDPGDRANLGVSAGDAGHEEPYLYVGPWGPRRPGDPGFWNAPFGAVLGRAAVVAAPEPLAAANAFLRRGVELLVAGP